MNGALNCSSWAVSNLSPLFRIVRPRGDEPSENYLGRSVESIAKTWGLKGEALVEIEDLPSLDGAWTLSHPLCLVHDSLHNSGIKSIPVIPSHADDAYIDAASTVAIKHHCSVGLRLYADDLEIPAEMVTRIREVASRAKLALESIELLVDLGSLRPELIPLLRGQLLDFVSILKGRADVGSITVLGSSIPENLKTVPQNSFREIPRLEMGLWRDVAAVAEIPIGIGDHLVVRPAYIDVEGPFPHINAKLFYSLDNKIAVFRGQSRRKEKLESQYSRLATALVESDYYLGEDFSWGDRQLSRIARRQLVMGDPTKFIAIATSHHLEQMAKQTQREMVALS